MNTIQPSETVELLKQRAADLLMEKFSVSESQEIVDTIISAAVLEMSILMREAAASRGGPNS